MSPADNNEVFDGDDYDSLPRLTSAGIGQVMVNGIPICVSRTAYAGVNGRYSGNDDLAVGDIVVFQKDDPKKGTLGVVVGTDAEAPMTDVFGDVVRTEPAFVVLWSTRKLSTASKGFSWQLRKVLP